MVVCTWRCVPATAARHTVAVHQAACTTHAPTLLLQHRFAVPPAEAKRKIPEVEEPFDIVGPVQVARRSDMDMNGHINNVTYLAWTLETVPEDVFAHGKLCQVCCVVPGGCCVRRVYDTL